MVVVIEQGDVDVDDELARAADLVRDNDAFLALLGDRVAEIKAEFEAADRGANLALNMLRY